jgi:hypothetical protein
MARQMEGMPKWMGWRQRAGAVLLGVLLLVSWPGEGRSRGFLGSGDGLKNRTSFSQLRYSRSDHWRGGIIPISNGKYLPRSASEGGGQDENLSPEEKARLRNKYRQWESLPPAKQEDLRRRMERWKQLPPGDQELLRKRYQQWQQFSPEERQRIRDKLNRWNELPPDEQERVRRQFRRPQP